MSRLFWTSASVVAVVIALVQPAGALMDKHEASGWSVAKVPSGQYSEILDASCPTASVCWGVEAQAVVHTTDGGKSWSETHSADLNGDGFYGISCPTSKDCWAVGGQGDAPPGDSSLFHTSDGGKTWKATDTEKAYGIGYADGLECADASTCMTAGLATPNGTPAIVVTTDGGGHWKKYGLAGPGSVESISCADSSHCWAVGSIDYRMKANKSGADSWSAMSGKALKSNDFTSISCPTSSDCLAIGSNGNNQPVASSTSDGGSKWHAVAAPKDMNLDKQVFCSSSTRCFAVGDFQTAKSSNNYDDAYIDRTPNLGGSWSVEDKAGDTSYKDDRLLDSISCGSASSCAATGANASDAAFALYTANGG